jgi:hypothetical protein
MAIFRKKGPPAHNPETRRKPNRTRRQDLAGANLKIRNAAIYSTLVVQRYRLRRIALNLGYKLWRTGRRIACAARAGALIEGGAR